MLTFPLAREADAPIIARLRQQCWAASYRGIYPDEMIDRFDHAWHASRDLTRIRHAAYTVRIIKEDEEPVGYIILHLPEATLMSLYILPSHQRRGIGRAAFDLISDSFRQTGQTCFRCQCLPQNASARAFYERMGGVPDGEDTGSDEPWQDSVIYRFIC